MPANGSKISFKKNGGPLTLEFVIGHGQWGRFRAFVCDDDGSNPQEFGHGVSDDNQPDVFPLPGSTSSLHKKMLTWEVAVAPLGGSDAQFYSVSVRLAQAGKPLEDGVILYSGAMGNGQFINDFVRLEGK